MLLTEPFEVAVVIAAQVAAATGPSRTSLPSMFGPPDDRQAVGRGARLDLGADRDHARRRPGTRASRRRSPPRAACS